MPYSDRENAKKTADFCGFAAIFGMFFGVKTVCNLIKKKISLKIYRYMYELK